MSLSELPMLGHWIPGNSPPAFTLAELRSSIPRIREPIHVVREGGQGRIGVAFAGELKPTNGAGAPPPPSYTWMATLPAIYPEWLGDQSFLRVHRVRFPYISGEMANGIATADMVLAMARHGMLGFFGSAGLPLNRLEQGLEKIQTQLGLEGASWGSNLIHSPNEPEMEEAVVNLYLRRKVRRVSASAFMNLTPAVVRYACAGLHEDQTGSIQRKNHVFAKISRTEVARHFMSPAPPEILRSLVSSGQLTTEEARLAARVPVAEDFTVEADSGGHTDNQALTALFPTILALKHEMMAHQSYRRPIRVGAAGGLGTPSALAASFSLGAAYVLTGSINQSAVESGLSDAGKALLAQASTSDVTMAPSADMFELGVRVQVLRRGTMYGARAQRLYDLYIAYPSLEAIPAETTARLEKEVFRAPLAEVWAETRSYFKQRNSREIEVAERDPKYRMALVFRWYLGQSSRWAIAGDESRRLDFQMWCGPAMGAFNNWVAGSFLSDLANRTVTQIALNLLEGAAVILRVQQLRSYGVPIPDQAFDFRPRPLT